MSADSAPRSAEAAGRRSGEASPIQKNSTQELREALAEACENIEMVENALSWAQCGEDENLPYREFFEACAKGDVTGVRDLLHTGINVSHQAGAATALHLAACNGHTAVVHLLLQRGANLEPRLGAIGKPHGAYVAGATPLLLAKANNREPLVQILLSHGADPNVRTDCGLKAEELLSALREVTPGLRAISLRLS